jgi:hypothetical protein
MTVLHPDASSGLPRPGEARTAPLARTDLALVLALMVAGAALAWSTAARFDPRFFKEPDGNDVWFEADLPTVADRVLHRWSDQSRNARHPLFPLMVAAPANVLAPLVGSGTALRLLIATIAAMWVAAIYLLLRAVTPRRLDALIFTSLASFSAAAVFWLPVPETYALGSISVIAALALAAWDPLGRAGAAAYVAAAAFSLAVTTTNWVSGLATLAARRPPRAALQLAANSLTVVIVLWSLQHLLFSSAPFFIGEGVQTRFILPEGAAGIGQALRAVLFHSVVMPAILAVPEPKWGTIMSVQDAAIGSGGAVAPVATALWAVILGLGAWAAATRPSPVRLPLLLALAGHLAVYAVYGEETFLYSLHSLPLLVCLAALTTTTALRPVVLGAAAVLTLLLAAHNTQALAGALAFFNGFRT